jgi:hypothetical protein
VFSQQQLWVQCHLGGLAVCPVVGYHLPSIACNMAHHIIGRLRAAATLKSTYYARHDHV